MLGGVGETPVHVRADELIGASPGREAFAAAGAAARSAVSAPRADLHASADHRRHLAGVVVERALRAANARIEGRAVMDADVKAIQLTVNGRKRVAAVEPRRLLSDCLREDLGLTGTNLGCEQGVCGACTVMVDGVSVRSCLMFAVQADGQRGARPSRAWPTATGWATSRTRSGRTTASSAASARPGC